MNGWLLPRILRNEKTMKRFGKFGKFGKFKFE